MHGTELSCVPNDTCVSEVVLQGHSAIAAVPSLKPCMGHKNDFTVKEKSRKSSAFTPACPYYALLTTLSHGFISTLHTQILERRARNHLGSALITGRNRLRFLNAVLFINLVSFNQFCYILNEPVNYIILYVLTLDPGS